MTAVEQTKKQRLDVRLAEDVKRLIEEAASCMGQSVSAFAVSALAEKARSVVSQHRAIALSARDRDRFLAALEADTEPTKRLKRAARRHAGSVIT